MKGSCSPGWIALIMLSMIQPAGAAAPKDHVHARGECVSCHPKDANITSVASRPDSNCLRCHTKDALKKGLENAIAGKPLPAGSDPADYVPKETIKPGDGMSFPQYYQKSRLGDEANRMAPVPAGPFIRGTDARWADEGPQYTLDVPAFMIDVYEVTNLQYKKFIEATGRHSPDHFRNRTYPSGKADHPVTFVTWDDAVAYCAWAGKRLPTDVEWEKAARGTDDARSFPWGNQFDVLKANTPIRWQAVKQPGDTTPVGAFEGGKSVYGVYDMTGNVWEWTASWYQPYPGNKTPSEEYGEHYKTLKGGSWFDCSFYKCGISAPVYNRAFFAKRTKNDTFGFRCAKDP